MQGEEKVWDDIEGLLDCSKLVVVIDPKFDVNEVCSHLAGIRLNLKLKGACESSQERNTSNVIWAWI